jgi:hypothetical protein
LHYAGIERAHQLTDIPGTAPIEVPQNDLNSPGLTVGQDILLNGRANLPDNRGSERERIVAPGKAPLDCGAGQNGFDAEAGLDRPWTLVPGFAQQRGHGACFACASASQRGG